MLKTLMTTAALILVATAALANTNATKKIEEMGEPLQIEIVMQTTEELAEKLGWCDLKAPEPKAGQIVIWYERDANGVCRAHAKQGK